jgi:hypothetical protein
MVNFILGPGKIFKYDPKRGKFRSLGPPVAVRAPVKICLSPPLYSPGPNLICTGSSGPEIDIMLKYYLRKIGIKKTQNNFVP